LVLSIGNIAQNNGKQIISISKNLKSFVSTQNLPLDIVNPSPNWMTSRRQALMPLRIPVTVAVTPLAATIWSRLAPASAAAGAASAAAKSERP